MGMEIVVNSMHRDVVDHVRPLLLTLLGAVGIVLLIACANVANLLLVRAKEREREIAVRVAYGGGQRRIIAQMLTESCVLAATGGVLGIGLVWVGIRLLVVDAAGQPSATRERSDRRYGLALYCGSVPLGSSCLRCGAALKSASPNLANALKERGSDAGGVRGNKVRTALVVAEAGLSLVLLIGAGLLVRSFAKLQQVEPGFHPQNVLTLSVPLPLFKYRVPDAY